MQNKYGEFYLKELIIILSHAGWLAGFGGLVEDLKQQGVVCAAMLAQEEYPVKENALYITDNAITLQSLLEKELQVAV